MLLRSILIGAVMTSVTLILHLWPYSVSMVNMSNTEYNPQGELIAEDYISNIVNQQENQSVFRDRVMTTTLIRSLEQLGLSTGLAYCTLIFFLIFLNGILINRLAISMGFSQGEAELSQLFYHCSFTILFALYTTIYTYNDPLQYTFFLTATLFLQKRMHALVGVLLIGATFCHEAILLLFPGLLIVDTESNWRRRMSMFIPPILCYFLYHLYLTDDSASDHVYVFFNRISCMYFNFQNADYAIESVFSLILATGLVAYLILTIETKRHTEQKWVLAFVITCILIIPIVFVLAKARESRLFALPLLYAWPLCGALIVRAWSMGLKCLTCIPYRLTVPIMCTSLCMAYFVSYRLYVQTGQWPDSNFHNEYLFLLLSVIFIHYSLTFVQRNREQSLTNNKTTL